MHSRLSDYDQRILSITGVLCVQLNISNYNPTFVSWEIVDSRSRYGAGFPLDECLVEHYCLTLSGRTKEVLEPEDWRPLIASSLIFSKKLRGRIVGAILLALVTFLLLSAILLVLGMTATAIALPLAPLGAIIIGLAYSKKARFVADRKAADMVSTVTFLATLNKIAGVPAPEPGSEEGSRSNLQRRISNLQRYSLRNQT